MTETPAYAIQKGVPMPRHVRGVWPKGSGGKLTYPFDQLEVTDCIFIPKEHPWRSIYTSATQYGIRHGWRFERRTMADGMRIWRVE